MCSSIITIKYFSRVSNFTSFRSLYILLTKDVVFSTDLRPTYLLVYLNLWPLSGLDNRIDALSIRGAMYTKVSLGRGKLEVRERNYFIYACAASTYRV